VTLACSIERQGKAFSSWSRLKQQRPKTGRLDASAERPLAMLSSSVQTFTEPDEYAAAIRATTVGLTVAERGVFSGKRVRM
jgi:hypothetical protein